MTDVEGEKDPTEELSVDECWALLATAEVGRLAVAGQGAVDIFPLNHRAQRGRLFFRTAEGTKLNALLVGSTVAFEVDGWDDRHAWSVVVRGSAEPVRDVEDLATAERAHPTPWAPRGKDVLVEIAPAEITGRRFPRTTRPIWDW